MTLQEQIDNTNAEIDVLNAFMDSAVANLTRQDVEDVRLEEYKADRTELTTLYGYVQNLISGISLTVTDLSLKLEEYEGDLTALSNALNLLESSLLKAIQDISDLFGNIDVIEADIRHYEGEIESIKGAGYATLDEMISILGSDDFISAVYNLGLQAEWETYANEMATATRNYTDTVVAGVDGALAEHIATTSAKFQSTDDKLETKADVLTVEKSFADRDMAQAKFERDISSKLAYEQKRQEAGVLQTYQTKSDAEASIAQVREDIFAVFEAGGSASDAAISLLNTAISDEAQARAEMGASMTTDYTTKIEDARSGLQQNIDTKASIDSLNTAVSNAEEARTSMRTSMETEFNSSLGEVDGKIDTEIGNLSATYLSKSQDVINRSVLDGKITLEEQSRIQAIADESERAILAENDLINQAVALDGKITVQEQNLVDKANELTDAYKAYNNAVTKAMSDGILTAEEQALISEAMVSIDALRNELDGLQDQVNASNGIIVTKASIDELQEAVSAVDMAFTKWQRDFSSKMAYETYRSEDETGDIITATREELKSIADEDRANFNQVIVETNATINETYQTKNDATSALAQTASTLTADYTSLVDGVKTQLEAKIETTDTVIAGNFKVWNPNDDPLIGNIKIDADGTTWYYLGDNLGENSDGWVKSKDQSAYDASDTVQTNLNALDSDVTANISNLTGLISSEEQARIDAVLAEEMARIDAINAQIEEQALLDGKISTAEQNTIDLGNNLTTAYQNYTDTVKQALIDGEITDAEASAIATAQTALNTAKTELQNNINTVSGWVASASKLITDPDTGSVTGWAFADGHGVQSTFKISADNIVMSGATTFISTNDSLADLDSSASNKLNGIQSGANKTTSTYGLSNYYSWDATNYNDSRINNSQITNSLGSMAYKNGINLNDLPSDVYDSSTEKINATYIDGDTLVTGYFAANTISANKISGGYIDADLIGANSITLDNNTYHYASGTRSAPPLNRYTTYGYNSISGNGALTVSCHTEFTGYIKTKYQGLQIVDANGDTKTLSIGTHNNLVIS